MKVGHEALAARCAVHGALVVHPPNWDLGIAFPERSAYSEIAVASGQEGLKLWLQPSRC